MRKTLLLALLSLPAIADSNIAENYSHLGFGYTSIKYSSGALKPYTNDEYDNKEDKTLGGLYLDLSANIVGDFFIEGYSAFNTRFSTSVDKWEAGVGYITFRNPIFSTPFSCGVVNFRTESDYAENNTEEGLYCKGGIKSQIANHWMAHISYQRDFLDTARDAIEVKNVFQFGSTFGLIAGLEFAKREEREIGINLGIQFSFH
ncbi:hypothetical protein [Vibrio sp. 99-8-1]|uniref:hypothetical protein n=1 Tax=Vibrio sp. 99-8-1 TaxID=2607602 RepID=UPI0014932AD3|nr:hypothetical protein [Vibrio sp. 99-8-1]NOI66883.1 hypothetical protein [Vibrio sp. 99-8-1]